MIQLNNLELVAGTGIIVVMRYFSDSDRLIPADPTAVKWRVQLPSDGTDDAVFVSGTDSEATKLSTGVYEFRYASAESGLVKFRAEATGAIVDAKELTIRYRPSAFDATAGPG